MHTCCTILSSKILNVSESEVSGVDSWHGLMEAQQGPVNNLNNPIEPAVQQVNNIIIINIIIITNIINNSIEPAAQQVIEKKSQITYGVWTLLSIK